MKRGGVLGAFFLLVLFLPSQSVVPVKAQTSAYGVIKVITLPKAPASFDISWADASMHRYFLADRTNAAVDIVDTTNDTLIAQVTGFAGATGKTATSGPNGVVTVPEMNQLWVGDGDSSVKVIDLATNTIVASISTGGTARSDEMAYDAADKLIVIANDLDETPFVSLISVVDHSVTTIPYPDSNAGLEQPVWDPIGGLIYQAVPGSKTNPDGELAVIDPHSKSLVNVLPANDCTPGPMTMGPNHQLLVGCNGGDRRHSIIMDVNGTIVTTITEVGGVDEVWYNPGDQNYYFAASSMTVDGTKDGRVTPVLGIVNAMTNVWIANIPTVPSAHSLAVDSSNNHIYMPLTNVGIGVYARMP
ncbi:MAG: YncE family protein [Dehalococcoidia bacterium]